MRWEALVASITVACRGCSDEDGGMRKGGMRNRERGGDRIKGRENETGKMRDREREREKTEE